MFFWSPQVGLWKASFDDYGQTSYAATAVAQLLMEELLGYNTRETGTGRAEEFGSSGSWESRQLEVGSYFWGRVFLGLQI